ncbi:MAG: radical SAM protein [Chloroflexi bacterium]|nr:radical SAM protein [Chloroflexota bacterium]MCL5075361.1 radical SAM protein [Chloroflexota bacterium]
MIGITKLICGTATTGDVLRYGRRSAGMPSHLLQFSADKRPVVVWNATRRCNLHCIHCYADSHERDYPGELSTAEAEAFIRGLSEFGVPVLLFSGGEPLLRQDLFELGALASALGIRAVISTNGTLITKEVARQIKDAGFGYVGVSIDGIAENNDRFRGKRGAFEMALQGIRNCVAVGQKVGLRFTINRHNYRDLSAVFDLIEEENIDRACFYHLVYAGRGSSMVKDDISHAETRAALELIIARTQDFHRRGLPKDILTVDNHADGVFIYLKVRREQPERAEEVLQLLRWNGGNMSGIGIAAVDNLGNVHADQFWWHYSFGNVRKRKFGEIWLDTSDPLMRGLKNREPLLKGRCARCCYLELCNGNFRVRAEAAYGDVWAEDPACYLTDTEIGLGDDEKSGSEVLT